MSANIEPERAIVQPSEQSHSADIRTALWLGLALFFFYLLTTSGHLPYTDEADYINLAHHLLHARIKMRRLATEFFQNWGLAIPLIVLPWALKRDRWLRC